MAHETEDAEVLLQELEEPPKACKTRLGLRLLQALATAAALVAASMLLWSHSPSFAAFNSGMQVQRKDETETHPPAAPCLCLFDVDRTLTARQDVVYHHDCQGAKQPDIPAGSPVPHDWAYGGGALVLSEVGNHLDETFCSKDRCHIGIVTAGSAGLDGPNGERGQIFERMTAASHGYSGDGTWSPAGKPLKSPLVWMCADPMKAECTKDVVNWLNEQHANIENENVYFFDDHRGNADEMSKNGYNGREVSCKSRDWQIGNGLVGRCGARLFEIVKERGVKNCMQLFDEGFYGSAPTKN